MHFSHLIALFSNLMYNNSQNSSNCCWFDHWTVCLLKVQSFYLRVSLHHQPCFMPFHQSIFFEFGLKNQFWPNDVYILWSRHKCPSLVVMQGLISSSIAANQQGVFMANLNVFYSKVDKSNWVVSAICFSNSGFFFNLWLVIMLC